MMKTLLINASPKANANNCNSKIIGEAFVSGMKAPCELRCIAHSDPKELAAYMQRFSAVLFVLPLYIHAMPGVMMDFIEHLRPAPTEGKSMGFIVQSGFIETAQQQYIERYFESLTRQLNYRYLGTVSKGEAAAIYMYPRMFQKVLGRFCELGRMYEETGVLNNAIAKELGKPYQLSARRARIYQLCCSLGLNNFGWHRMLKKNNAFDKRLDRPFL